MRHHCYVDLNFEISNLRCSYASTVVKTMRIIAKTINSNNLFLPGLLVRATGYQIQGAWLAEAETYLANRRGCRWPLQAWHSACKVGP
eukprot:1307506-Amphidinium_carterae.1